MKNKPTFEKFLYQKFNHPIKKTFEENKEEFAKFNLDINSENSIKANKFKIPKFKKNLFPVIPSYHDVIYDGASDAYNPLNSIVHTIEIENRPEKTFKFNSVKVIDSVLRSNKNKSIDYSIHDTSKFLRGNSPSKKLKDIFKQRNQDSSRDNSFSASILNINDDDNKPFFNNKKISKKKSLSSKVDNIMSNLNKGNYNGLDVNLNEYEAKIKDVEKNISQISNTNINNDFKYFKDFNLLSRRGKPQNKQSNNTINNLSKSCSNNNNSNINNNNSLLLDKLSEKNYNNNSNNNKEYSKINNNINNSNYIRNSSINNSTNFINSHLINNSNFLIPNNSNTNINLSYTSDIKQDTYINSRLESRDNSKIIFLNSNNNNINSINSPNKNDSILENVEESYFRTNYENNNYTGPNYNYSYNNNLSYNNNSSIELSPGPAENEKEKENFLTQKKITSILNKKVNFIEKNIKLAKNYTRKKIVENQEIKDKQNLKRKLHLLLKKECINFCKNFRKRNNSFNNNIEEYLASDDLQKKRKNFYKNFRYKGLNYNPGKYVFNTKEIDKNFSNAENVILENISPTELKIIQSDVNYYINDKELIKDNPILKIKKLTEVMHDEDEEEEFNNNNKDSDLYYNLNKKKFRRNNILGKKENEEKVKLFRKSLMKKSGNGKENN